MGIRELREKYGEVKGNMAVNDAVRCEVPGGEKLFNLTAWLFRQKDLNEREKSTLQVLLSIQMEMKKHIIQKYQLKNQEIENE
ncbi:MAG: hypothetical protein LBQ54_13200 [Planctomycetaceae bacterium]|jgi:hypothetical protein|nr:hypothetical protein [Planctomycetaceae bacterium]